MGPTCQHSSPGATIVIQQTLKSLAVPSPLQRRLRISQDAFRFPQLHFEPLASLNSVFCLSVPSMAARGFAWLQEEYFLAHQVEVAQCSSCGQQTRFPRALGAKKHKKHWCCICFTCCMTSRRFPPCCLEATTIQPNCWRLALAGVVNGPTASLSFVALSASWWFTGVGGLPIMP